jgi:phosphoglycerate dehydrogenase-like enzyme
MSIKNRVVGFLKYKRHVDAKLLKDCYNQVGPCLQAACPNVTFLEYVIGDDDILTDEQVSKLRSLEIIVCGMLVFRNKGVLPALNSVKWVHVLSAGVDAITRNCNFDQYPRFILTKNASFFDTQVLEYVIGMIMAREKGFIQLHHNQQNKLWRSVSCRLMSDVSLGIVGFGGIGRKLAKVAREFLNMKVWGLVRTISEDERNGSDETAYHLTTSLPELLSSCDYICNLLPSTDATDGFFDGDVLSHCAKKKSVFINVGRGNVVKESTILNALERGWLSHAILDVFDTEPLPTSSPLWDNPNVTVTPHSAVIDFDAKLFAESFAKNYHHYTNGEPMENVVDWSKGY